MKNIEKAIRTVTEALNIEEATAKKMILEEFMDSDLIQVYCMDFFDEYFQDLKPLEIAQKIFYGDFRYCDDYFIMNGYDNIETIADIEAYLENEFNWLNDNEVEEIISDLI